MVHLFISETRQHYFECAVDFFVELREDHIISGSIPTTRHPLYDKIKRDNLELYRIMGDKKKIKETKQFYEVYCKFRKFSEGFIFAKLHIFEFPWK